jgi:hypothetical protein
MSQRVPKLGSFPNSHTHCRPKRFVFIRVHSWPNVFAAVAAPALFKAFLPQKKNTLHLLTAPAHLSGGQTAHKRTELRLIRECVRTAFAGAVSARVSRNSKKTNNEPSEPFFSCASQKSQLISQI